eukprot:gene20311-27067_t
MSLWWSISLLVLAACLRSSDAVAGGITTWCNAVDPLFPGQTRAAAGAAACVPNAGTGTNCGFIDGFEMAECPGVCCASAHLHLLLFNCNQFLLGRVFTRVGCNSQNNQFSGVLFYKVLFVQPFDRDFFYQIAAGDFFWNTLVQQMPGGCDFFGAYAQTVGTGPTFTEPHFAFAPTAAPFGTINTVNPYITACSAFTAPGAGRPGTVPLISGGQSALNGWAPVQNPSFLATYSFGGVGALGTNWGINTQYYTSATLPPGTFVPYLTPCTLFLNPTIATQCNAPNVQSSPPPSFNQFFQPPSPPPTFTGGFFQPSSPPPAFTNGLCSVTVTASKIATFTTPFDPINDPGKLGSYLASICGNGVNFAFPGVKFTAGPQNSNFVVSAVANLVSGNDQVILRNCLIGSPTAIQFTGNNLGLSCTDQIRVDYSCFGVPLSVFSGVAASADALQTGLGNVLAATTSLGDLLGGLTSINCIVPMANVKTIIAPFYSAETATRALDSLTRSNILISGFVVQAGLPCGATMLIEIPSSGYKQTFQCGGTNGALFQLCCVGAQAKSLPPPLAKSPPPIAKSPPTNNRRKSPPPMLPPPPPPPTYGVYGDYPPYNDYPPSDYVYYYYDYPPPVAAPPPGRPRQKKKRNP